MSVILLLKTVFIETHSVASGPLTSAPTWKLGHVADYYYLCFFMQLFFNTQIIKNWPIVIDYSTIRHLPQIVSNFDWFVDKISWRRHPTELRQRKNKAFAFHLMHYADHMLRVHNISACIRTVHYFCDSEHATRAGLPGTVHSLPHKITPSLINRI